MIFLKRYFKKYKINIFKNKKWVWQYFKNNFVEEKTNNNMTVLKNEVVDYEDVNNL